MIFDLFRLPDPEEIDPADHKPASSGYTLITPRGIRLHVWPIPGAMPARALVLATVPDPVFGRTVLTWCAPFVNVLNVPDLDEPNRGRLIEHYLRCRRAA